MIGSYWLAEETNDLRELAKSLGLSTSMWIQPFRPLDPRCWYPRDTEMLDYNKLLVEIYNRIYVTGYTDHPRSWRGLIGPNYEAYPAMYHPGVAGDWPLLPQDSFDNHARLYRFIKSEFPESKVFCWGLGSNIREWNTPHHLPGVQMMGRLAEIYDVMCPSCYLHGRDDDHEHIIANLTWSQSVSKPIIAYFSPWKRDRKGDGLWYAATPDEMANAMQLAMQFSHVVQIEMWSMVKHSYLEKGFMEPGITTPEQIDIHHRKALQIIAGMVDTWPY
jgi:hypothetical protein